MDIIFHNLIGKINMPVIFSHRIYKNCFLQSCRTHLLSAPDCCLLGVWSHDLQLWASVCHMVTPPLSIQIYSTEIKQNTEDKITSCSFSLLGLQTEHLAQRNCFIGKLEKAHTKLSNTVQNYVPMCDYLDDFSTSQVAHIKQTPPSLFFFLSQKRKTKSPKNETSDGS